MHQPFRSCTLLRQKKVTTISPHRVWIYTDLGQCKIRHTHTPPFFSPRKSPMNIDGVHSTPRKWLFSPPSPFYGKCWWESESANVFFCQKQRKQLWVYGKELLTSFFKKKRSVGGNPGVAPIFLSPPVGIMLIYASPRIFLPPLPPPLSEEEEEECKAGRPAEYKLSSFLIFFAHHLPFPLFFRRRDPAARPKKESPDFVQE